VAIRILKAHLSQSAQSELSLYGLLLASAEREPSHAHSLVKLFTSFELIGPNGQHACFVFEVMGPNLSDMLRSQEFHVGHPFDDDFCCRFPKHLAKRILKGVLHGLQFLHRNKIVHGDVHKGNILVNVLPPQYTADSLENLRRPADEARPMERLDGKKDLWAPPYLLPPANLRSYVFTESDPFSKLTDIGGGQYSLMPQYPIGTVGEVRS
jgi:non-specific serine/threonine protein kinase